MSLYRVYRILRCTEYCGNDGIFLECASKVFFFLTCSCSLFSLSFSLSFFLFHFSSLSPFKLFLISSHLFLLFLCFFFIISHWLSMDIFRTTALYLYHRAVFVFASILIFLDRMCVFKGINIRLGSSSSFYTPSQVLSVLKTFFIALFFPV